MNNKKLCYCFGGHTWHSSFRDDKKEYCYLDEFELQAKTDKNTCAELDGIFEQVKNGGYRVCKIPLENVEKLRPRKHPNYSDNHFEQKTYELLVEEAQATQLMNEFLDKKEPDRKDKSLDNLTKIPFASVHKIKEIKDGKAITEKIHDLTLSKENAKRLIESLNTFILEEAVKDRLSQQFYDAFYYELSSNEKAKIRYRINKFTKEFKI